MKCFVNKRIIFFFLFFFLFIFAFRSHKVYSIECSPDKPIQCTTLEECNQLEALCQQKLNGLNQQANTLTSQIQYMNTQINLATLRIQEAEAKIISTQSEIETIETRIETLDSSLNQLSKQLIERIIQSYKNRGVSLFEIIFGSGSASDLINQLKYMRLTQENNQRLLIHVQEAKSNFEDQKKLREQKKKELDTLKITLNNLKATLDQQKSAKQKLLVDTQNDETVYQRLIAQARAQQTAFSSFVASSGFGNIIGPDGLGRGNDGNYYSQRDSRWANRSIGYSSESILNVGCLLTSIAMTAKKFGANLTPLDIATDVSRFFGNTAYMKLPWPGVAGKSYVSLSKSDAENELQNGNYVIAGILRTSCANGGDHFVVLTRKEGDDYKMHDPIYGPDQSFKSHYSSFCSFAAFK